MKAIIIAAGMGSRLGSLTEVTPKPLLKLGDKTIIERTIEIFRNNGIKEIAIVRGYLKEEFKIPNITYYDNDNYMSNNILSSLFCAQEMMDGGFISTYADIIYRESVVKKLIESPNDISLIVDTDWRERYAGRTEHPTDQAEIVQVSGEKITRISKFINPDIAYGEFIGLAKFSAKGSEILQRNYKRLRNSTWCKYQGHQRFHDATNLEKAYLTDMIQELIDRGYPISPVDIQRSWVEIDTLQDLEYAKEEINNGEYSNEENR